VDCTTREDDWRKFKVQAVRGKGQKEIEAAHGQMGSRILIFRSFFLKVR